MLRISVIVPALNEDKDIEHCLRFIRGQGYPNFDITLVDSGSTDRTVEIARRYVDKILVMKADGPGPARNLGARDSNADIVAFTDADTQVAPNWIEKIAEDFSDPEVIGVGGIFKPRNPRLLDRIMFKINSDWWYRLTAKIGFYQLGTPNCAYRRDAFLRAGGFDESLSMLEDTELSLRMSRYGKLIIDKDLWVYNSARRFRQEGYLRVFIRYLKAYFTLFIGRGVKETHFNTIKH